MIERPWWTLFIKWSLWIGLMTVIMNWLGRSRFRRRCPEERGTLRHPTSTLILGLVGFCFFAVLMIYSAFSTNKTATWRTTVGFAGFAAMSVPMILDYFMAKHRLLDEGLAYRKLLGATGFLRWSELRKVRYGCMMKWFRLETKGGKVVRISALLTGLPEFAQALLNSAPAEAIDADTLQILEATAEGDPPSVWV